MFVVLQVDVGSADVVSATIAIFNAVAVTLKPTPLKSHYSFNLRDVSKVFQGICQCNPITIEHKSHVSCCDMETSVLCVVQHVVLLCHTLSFTDGSAVGS